ncbi:soluble calcium-activated nucleotidase 1 [Anopheles arabiensis]|uniref:Apyrase n=5 Tax=gambiae species complex TaxID=44542 RepID=Q7PX52_ANOGA|nr:soluble calcium-activated nucleotidase 1 [Anopheles arabiensis]XP_040228307.2 soluble calcium-activated nucleotidase 1 [Anopheles coluzzii]XP_041761710.1 soluble calcium-activated nucleotidase 1 [Anopheles merus]XP_321938.3 soluble calcium-activated nucleotidase 1 [Anopheles gambiae]EAA01797.3 AGAP001217-PA [Anopheles gambiae str. PEST]
MKQFNGSISPSSSSSSLPFASLGSGKTSSKQSSGSTIIDTGMYLRDWRKALRSPPSYRIGNRTIRLQVHFTWVLATLCAFLLLVLYISSSPSSLLSDGPPTNSFLRTSAIVYNHTYPLTSPIVSSGIYSFRVGIIADLDTNSALKKNQWGSYYLKGYLSFIPSKRSITVSWDEGEAKALQSGFALKGRGMELSELVVFNGKLLTFDDRTGLVYEIEGEKVIPWVLLMDGDGRTSKGFKSEWATVKDQVLYVGSMGKEWTTSAGDFETHDPMYVKAVTVHGEVYHLNWINHYKAIRKAIGIEWPGYMIHESGAWSEVHRRWFFLPRRCSRERYNETRDEHMGCNFLISSDETFQNIRAIELKRNDVPATHGYSSFKFLPTSNDEIIVALSTEELNGKTSSFISAFTVEGEQLMVETRINTEYKYEGLEFI